MNLKEILQQQANIIQSEVRLGANTANRIGTIFLAIIDALQSDKELQDSFISKNKEDQAKFIIDFLAGLKVGENASIDAGGNAQFNSLSVYELIVNRLTAVNGDYVFGESATIESLVQTDHGYTVTFRKDFESQLIGFAQGDVLRGRLTSIQDGLDYTSWMRVSSIIDNVASIVLYPSPETPAGQNHPPTELMVLQHWGNAINKDRQSTWYLSSQEGRIVFLDGVTKPILEDHNYSSFWGKPPQLKQFEGQPINYNQPYFYSRGTILQDIIRLDYNGVPQVDIKDYGLWYDGFVGTSGANAPYVQSDVWHNGCKWRCIVPSTKSEPRWNSTDWVLISGDRRLSLELTATNGNQFRFGTVDTSFIATVYYGNTDITPDIQDYDWEWLRESGNVNDDKDWAERHKNTTSSIHIGNEDVGTDFGINKRVTFICKVFVRQGNQIEKLEQKIKLR